MTISSAEVAPAPAEPVLAWESLPQTLRQRLASHWSTLLQREWQRRLSTTPPTQPGSSQPEVGHE